MFCEEKVHKSSSHIPHFLIVKLSAFRVKTDFLQEGIAFHTAHNHGSVNLCHGSTSMIIIIIIDVNPTLKIAN